MTWKPEEKKILVIDMQIIYLMQTANYIPVDANWQMANIKTLKHTKINEYILLWHRRCSVELKDKEENNKYLLSPARK